VPERIIVEKSSYVMPSGRQNRVSDDLGVAASPQDADPH
jgi:hypothetical protein